MKHHYFIQEGFKHSKKGVLHRELHIPEHEKIPIEVLEHIKNMPLGHHTTIHGHPITITHLLKKRAVFLLNVDRIRKR